MPSTAWSSGASSKTTLAALPPSSRVSFLPVPATARWISLPTSVDPVNAILSTPGCATRACPVAPSPVRMFTVPGGRSACWMTSASSSAVRGRGLGRLEHARVAGRQRRGQLPGRHQQREVPRDDLARHPQRPRVRAEPGVLQLVRPARVVEEVRGGQRDVHVPRFPDRLAVVQAFQHRELAGPLLDDPGDPVQVLGPVPARGGAPGALVGRAGRGDRPVHVLLPGLGHLGERAPRWPGSGWRSTGPRPGGRTRRR